MKVWRVVLVDKTINACQSRAARYGAATFCMLPAPNTPVLPTGGGRKIFSSTGRGAFFLISQKEWGAQSLINMTGIFPFPVLYYINIMRYSAHPGKENLFPT